jgi:hypothetical protein
MKRALLPLILTLALALPMQEARAAKFEGLFVYDAEGKVTLTRDRKSQPISSDVQLVAGDVMKTESASDVQLSLVGNLSLLFKEFGHIEVKSNYPSEQKITVYNGDVLVNAKSLTTGTKLNIETPNAIIQVKLPAQFMFRVYADEKGNRATTMAVKKGKVGIFFKEGSAVIDILEDQAIDVGRGSFISNPRQATDEELKIAAKANNVLIVSEDEL